MLKKITSLIIVAVFFSGVGMSTAQADTGTSVCSFIKDDNQKEFRSFLKKRRLKIRNIYSEVVCDGTDMLAFASANNAIVTGEYMMSKLPRTFLKTRIGSITNVILRAFAEKRIS